MTVRVAIGMPVYNGAKWLGPTIETLLAQRFGDFELTVSDNASTDPTEELVRALAARDRRVRYHRNAENIGVARNFSLAFKLTRAPLFKWLSCGDALHPDFLARCVEEHERRPDAVLIYPATRLFEHDVTEGVDSIDPFDLDVPDPVERVRAYLTQVGLNNIMHGVYRSEALARTRLYSPFLGADINMIAEVLLHGRVVQLREVLNYRRTHAETITRYLAAADLRKMYAPNNPSALKYQSWHAMLDYLGLPLRAAPLSLAERLRLLGFLSRVAFWRREDLLSELKARGMAAK